MYKIDVNFRTLSLVFFLTLIHPLVRTNADQEEDDFIATFGKNNETSGVWQDVRNIASDTEKLKLLCKRAHLKMGLGAEDEISHVRFETKILTFHNYNLSMNRLPINLDTVIYGVTRAPESAWYFTKGTTPSCVFYLILWDTIETTFRLGLEACGVHIPV